MPAASTELTVSVTFAPGCAPLTRMVRGVSAAETLGLTVSRKPPAVAVAGMTATIAASTTPAQTARSARCKVLRPMMPPPCSQPVREASTDRRFGGTWRLHLNSHAGVLRRWSGPRLAET